MSTKMQIAPRPTTNDQVASTIREWLRAQQVFSTLSNTIIDDLASIIQEATLPGAAVLFEQGADATHLYVLLQGQVALWGAAPDGTSAVVEVVHPPDHFVLAPILTQLPHLTSARAVTPVRLLMIEADGLRHLLEREASLANALFRAEAMSFREMVRQVQDLKLRNAAERLACYLLGLVEDPNATGASFRLPFEKGLLAARLGCRQENLSRAFATLRSVGVETHGARVILHNIPALRAFAGTDEKSGSVIGRAA
ncbi:MAG: cyclic nucleotide-binding domain-containing protein [Acetobacteraceae bacterium]|nr:cyclic nucleotide-binding domain-containing protein [Acetobacteraceae bacterium]